MSSDGFRKSGQVWNLPFTFSDGRAILAAMLLALAVGLALWTHAAQAQAPPAGYDEAEAQAIDRMLMCPVCPAESIDQAQVPLARQMRQRVREMLAEGASRQEILDYFADRYGQNVLASPPKSGFNLLAWVLPVAGLLVGLAAVVLVLRAMRGRNDGPAGVDAPAVSEDGELEPYLDAVDRTLALDSPDATSNAEE